MMAIVMDEEMRDTGKWYGSVGVMLGGHSYATLTSDAPDDFDKSVRDIADEIHRRFENALPNEQKVAANLMSALRSPSPSPSDTHSGKSTPLQTQRVLQPSVVGMLVDGEVQTFREDMQKFIRDFLAGSSKQHRVWQLCELLLVGFVRDMVEPSCDNSDAVEADLIWWRGKCMTPAVRLIEMFHDMMTDLEPKPRIFVQILQTYRCAIAEKKDNLCFLSVVVIDWMVQHSKWALVGKSSKREWCNDVVMQWFEEGNKESTEIFLERAENFLQGTEGEKWGMTILGKVIESNSYVVFFRMEALASILLREHCGLHLKQFTRLKSDQIGDGGSNGGGEVREGDGGGSASLLPITMLVSSANWHLSIDYAGD